MQIEIYEMRAEKDTLKITLEAVCDSFSSLLWDIRYYECGQFEVYIAATERNMAVFQTKKIIGRSDDTEHYGIIEKVLLETDAENGDYLTVSGRFLMSILSRRIIYPTLSFTTATSYGEILRQAVYKNCIYPFRNPYREDAISAQRIIPGLQLGTVTGSCWERTTTLQISYENLMEWIYTICKVTGGTANLCLRETALDSGEYTLHFELTEGIDRSVLQDNNPHLVFSDGYNNLLSFSHEIDASGVVNYTYTFGSGEGDSRYHIGNYWSPDTAGLNRYEKYVDARDISREIDNGSGETVEMPMSEYTALLTARAAENSQTIVVTTESEIAADNLQYQYNRDYFVGDYVTVEHSRFGLMQPRVQLTGMIESFDQNGRSLTPTFEIREEESA